MALLLHQLAWLLTVVALLVALNLVAGKGGVWAVGQLAFFGVGSYAMGWSLAQFGGTPVGVAAGLAMAGTVACALAFVVAGTALKLRQDFFVIFSIALLELVRNLLISWQGPDGFQRLPRVRLLPGVDQEWAVVVGLMAPFVLVLVWWSVRAEGGAVDRVYALVRRSEETAVTLGRDPLALKRTVFVVSAGVTAIAAAMYTTFTSSTEPMKLQLTQALLLFAALVLGGLNSTLGAVLGALVLVAVPRLLEVAVFSGPTGSYYAAQGELILFGLCLIVLIRRHPAGLAGRAEVPPHG